MIPIFVDAKRDAMLTYPEIDPVIFSIGFLKIRWYGLMYVVGFVLAWWLARRRCRRTDSPVTPEQVDDLVFYSMLGVILGGRIGYALFYGTEQLISDPLYLFRITEGGMSFHGGLAGVLIAMWLYGRRLGHTMWRMTDFVAPLVPLGLGFGRIGNFINGELWGKPTDVPWAFLVNGQVLHPTQLYESALNLLNFALLFFVYKRRRFGGQVFALYFFNYALIRFFIEFWRGDTFRGFVLRSSSPWTSLSIPQLVSLIGLGVGITLYLRLKKKATA